MGHPLDRDRVTKSESCNVTLKVWVSPVCVCVFVCVCVCVCVCVMFESCSVYTCQFVRLIECFDLVFVDGKTLLDH